MALGNVPDGFHPLFLSRNIAPQFRVCRAITERKQRRAEPADFRGRKIGEYLDIDPRMTADPLPCGSAAFRCQCRNLTRGRKHTVCHGAAVYPGSRLRTERLGIILDHTDAYDGLFLAFPEHGLREYAVFKPRMKDAFRTDPRKLFHEIIIQAVHMYAGKLKLEPVTCAARNSGNIQGGTVQMVQMGKQILLFREMFGRIRKQIGQ